MDLTRGAVAEKLACEFPRIPNSTVLRVVTDCVDKSRDSDAMFIEQASRA